MFLVLPTPGGIKGVETWLGSWPTALNENRTVSDQSVLREQKAHFHWCRNSGECLEMKAQVSAG
jgi:hypothetical protein